jgi:hypothetical protein
MGTDEFNNIFSTIYLSQCKRPPPDLSHERYIAIRMLDSLGHCEFDFDSRRVYVCSPLLVSLPTWGLPKTVLTGARSPSLVGYLKIAIKKMRGSARLIRRQHRGYPILPEAIIIESTDLETIKKAANISKIAYKQSVPAWEIINYASGIDEILKISDFEERAELNWKRRIFSTKYMQFLRKAENQEEVKLVEYVNPVNQQRVHWFWKGKLASKVDRDWGRYMALANCGVNILIYDKLRNRLSVPEYVPLPRFFARALALCSGIAPARATISAHNELGFPPNFPVSIFSEAPPRIVGILSSKLSQVPIAHDLTIDKNGEIL